MFWHNKIIFQCCFCFVFWLLSPQVLKLDLEKADKLVHMYLFTGADSQELDKSINRQLSKSELWQKLAEQNNNTISNSNLDTGKTIRDWAC